MMTSAAAVTPASLAPASDRLGAASISSIDSGSSSDASASFGSPSRSPAFLEASICRLYYFNEDQIQVVHELIKSMENARSAVTALALASLGVSLAQAGAHPEGALVLGESGLTVGDVAYWADALLVAALINYAINPFQKVMKSRSNQMAYCFQGVNRMALIFQQLSIGSVAVSTITALDAAAKYPPLVLGASAVFFGVAVVRSAAMWWTLSVHATSGLEVSRTLDAFRHPETMNDCSTAGLPPPKLSPLDRLAVFLAFGYLLQYEDQVSGKLPSSSQSAHSQQVSATTSSSSSSSNGHSISSSSGTSAAMQPKSASPPPLDYEFSLAEERLLRGLTEASSTAGLALALQSFVTFMLAVADFGVSDFPEVVSNGINGTNKAVMAALLFNACATYDRALHTAGTDDVAHLMDGLGHKGITGLFGSLAVLSWAVTIATLAGLALPLLEENLLARAVGDGLSHRTAEAVVEVLEYARAILRGI